RGHFRAGFDEFFPPERVLEVDTPGLTSPVLERLEFKGLPRPWFPLDVDAVWTPRVAAFSRRGERRALLRSLGLRGCNIDFVRHSHSVPVGISLQRQFDLFGQCCAPVLAQVSDCTGCSTPG